ncbi:hypothetical protein PQX77_019744 [Marasmius sp. AFHP31]|nr:hypothetical protein PQX77_019744 [Marasmius sp. AFHP31]
MEILYYNLRDFEDVGFAELLTAVQVVLGESREAVPLLRGESIVNEFVREEEYGLVDDDEGVADIESGRESSTYSELSSYVSSQADSDDLYQDPSLLPDSNVNPTMTQEDFSMADSFENNAEEPLIPDPPLSTLGSVGDTPSEHTNAPLVGPAVGGVLIPPSPSDLGSFVPLERFQQEHLGRIGAVEELQRLRRRVTALEEEIEGLRAQNEELREGMRRSQEVDGTNVNQNLSRFLTHNGITVSPAEIPTLLEIAERGVHAPAGQILGAVAAMTEDHHSQLLRIQAERVDSPPEVTNMLRFLVHEASGMSNFVRSAVSSFNSVSNMSDRRNDYEFLHERGSRGRHALLRMREEGLRWNASMAARTEGWVQMDPSTKVIGKRKGREEDGENDGSGPSKR